MWECSKCLQFSSMQITDIPSLVLQTQPLQWLAISGEHGLTDLSFTPFTQSHTSVGILSIPLCWHRWHILLAEGLTTWGIQYPHMCCWLHDPSHHYLNINNRSLPNFKLAAWLSSCPLKRGNNCSLYWEKGNPMSLEHRSDHCFVWSLLSEFLFHTSSQNPHLYLYSDAWGFASLMWRLDPQFHLTWRGLPFISCFQPTCHLAPVTDLAEEWALIIQHCVRMYIYNCSKLSLPHYGNHACQVKGKLIAGLRVKWLVQSLKLVSMCCNASLSTVHKIKTYIFIIACVSMLNQISSPMDPASHHVEIQLAGSKPPISSHHEWCAPIFLWSCFNHPMSTNCQLLSHGQAQSLALDKPLKVM